MSRRYGVPRTEEERAEQHELFYPGTELPERGTGIQSQFGAARRRAYWEQQAGYAPPYNISGYPWETAGVLPVVIPLSILALICVGVSRRGKS